MSCSVQTKNNDFYGSSYVDKQEIDSFDLPRHAINDVVKGLAYQMLESSSFVNPKTPIAIASFVELKNLESTNWLGNQLSESFVHEMQRHGLVVIDFKTTGHIRVSPADHLNVKLYIAAVNARARLTRTHAKQTEGCTSGVVHRKVATAGGHYVYQFVAICRCHLRDRQWPFGGKPKYAI